MAGVRNPATEQADRILALLDNPTQSSFEDMPVDHEALSRMAASVQVMADAFAAHAEAVADSASVIARVIEQVKVNTPPR